MKNHNINDYKDVIESNKAANEISDPLLQKIKALENKIQDQAGELNKLIAADKKAQALEAELINIYDRNTKLIKDSSNKPILIKRTGPSSAQLIINNDVSLNFENENALGLFILALKSLFDFDLYL